MYDAILFDLDGTLIDTESLAVAAGLVAFAAAGHPVDLPFMHRLVGIDGPTSARIISAHRPDLELPRLDALWRQGFEDRMRQSLTQKPGVTELLSHAPHLPRVLVTSSGKADHEHLVFLHSAGDFHRLEHCVRAF